MNKTESPIVQIAKRLRTSNISEAEMVKRAHRLASEILNREVHVEVKEVDES